MRFVTLKSVLFLLFIGNYLSTLRALAQPQQLPTNNDPNNQIRFSTPAAADAVRVRLTNFIWTDGLPTGRLPAVTPNNDSNVFSGNLRGIDQSLVSQVAQLDSDVSGFDFHSFSYLLRPVNSANTNRIVIVHQGHAEIDPLGGGLARTANSLLQQGFSVDLMQMPMFGWNYDHTAVIPGQGALDYDREDPFNSHVAMIHTTGPPQGGMGFRLFLEPVIQNINYLETLPGFSDITMIGLSGGGWTTHMAAAIDTRVRLSFPVAGSAPLYWRNIVGKIDGAEEEYIPLYNENIAPDGSGGGVATWLEIYSLGGYGNGRKQIMVTNLFDPCCFSGTYADGFKAIVSTKVSVLGQGEWGYYRDSTTLLHEISANTLNTIILPSLAAQPAKPSLTGVGDFNGDGKADILGRDVGGTVAMWLMNGPTITSYSTISNVGTGWSIAGVADFNGDGTADILGRDAGGTVAMWLMNGPTITTYSTVANVWTGWSIAGVADFNGDGTADILWRDAGGTLAMWLMNGPTITTYSTVANVWTGWSIAGVADFNGDGTADILWRDAGGTVAMWLMNGPTITSYSTVANVWTGWSIAGVGDFNGDGTADILWRDAGGTVAMWLMNGPTVTSYSTVANVWTGWSIAGVGDFNGDGTADILWRDAGGTVAMWLMNGPTITSYSTVANV